MQSKYQDDPKYWGLSDADYAKVVVARKGIEEVEKTYEQKMDDAFNSTRTGASPEYRETWEGVARFQWSKSNPNHINNCHLEAADPDRINPWHQEKPMSAEDFIHIWQLTHRNIEGCRVKVTIEVVSAESAPGPGFLASAMETVRPTLEEQVKAAMDRHRKNEAAGKYIGKGDPVAKAE